MAALGDLPFELVGIIRSYLPVPDVKALRRASRIVFHSGAYDYYDRCDTEL
jgi:hypothetical protein